MKEWLYWFVRGALQLPFRIFVRKLHLDGLENYPKDKPVFLAVNHPNSFLDGVVFEAHFKRRIYTLVRGDVFNKPLPNYILRGLRLLPIFRARDAAAERARKGNEQTSEEVYQLFKKNRTVLIFAEGVSYPEKAVRALKKGTGRMAIEWMKKSNYELDLHIVPTSINYSTFGSLRRDIHVKFGKSIHVPSLKPQIESDENKVLNVINAHIKSELLKGVVLTKGEEQKNRERLHEMIVNVNRRKFGYIIKNKWETSIEKVNEASSDLLTKVEDYWSHLKKNKIEDSNVANVSADFLSFFIALFTLTISFPVYVVWWLFWKLSLYISTKKVKNPIFTDSIIIGSGMVLTLLLIVGVFVFFAFAKDGIWVPIFSLLSLYGALCWFRVIDTLPYLWREIQYFGLDKSTKEGLKSQREAILQKVT